MFDMHISLFHKEKWCLDKKSLFSLTLAIEMNKNGGRGVTIPYLQWLLSHFIIRVM